MEVNCSKVDICRRKSAQLWINRSLRFATEFATDALSPRKTSSALSLKDLRKRSLKRLAAMDSDPIMVLSSLDKRSCFHNSGKGCQDGKKVSLNAKETTCLGLVLLLAKIVSNVIGVAIKFGVYFVTGVMKNSKHWFIARQYFCPELSYAALFGDFAYIVQ